MTIEYYIREVYGIKNYYAVDKEIASAITKLTGKKTITISTMEALNALGFLFTQVINPNYND